MEEGHQRQQEGVWSKAFLEQVVLREVPRDELKLIMRVMVHCICAWEDKGLDPDSPVLGDLVSISIHVHAQAYVQLLFRMTPHSCTQG